MKVVYFGNSLSYYNISLMNQMKANGIDCQIVDVFKELEFVKRRFKNIRYLRTMELVYSFKKILKRYHFDVNEDIAHVNFVDFRYAFCVSYFKKKFKKYVIYFWGSDLYRQRRFILKLMRPLYKYAANICFETPKIADDFHKIIPKFRDKDYFLRFGLPILDEIDNVKIAEIETFKMKFNIPKDKEIIVIGYNGKKEQQHIDVVKSLKNDVIKESFFIFPWTYGDIYVDYYTSLETLCKEKKMSYVFIKQKLSDIEMACFRCTTDILVQVQTKYHKVTNFP